MFCELVLESSTLSTSMKEVFKTNEELDYDPMEIIGDYEMSTCEVFGTFSSSVLVSWCDSFC
jgi:hypothetical protein